VDRADRTKFWLRVMNELRTRGVNDILIAVVDGLNDWGRSAQQSHRPRCKRALFACCAMHCRLPPGKTVGKSPPP
jgi:putative transposase